MLKRLFHGLPDSNFITISLPVLWPNQFPFNFYNFLDVSYLIFNRRNIFLFLFLFIFFTVWNVISLAVNAFVQLFVCSVSRIWFSNVITQNVSNCFAYFKDSSTQSNSTGNKLALTKCAFPYKSHSYLIGVLSCNRTLSFSWL